MKRKVHYFFFSQRSLHDGFLVVADKLASVVSLATYENITQVSILLKYQVYFWKDFLTGLFYECCILGGV